MFRVDCDEIVICDEVAASSADDLKKAKKVNVEHFKRDLPLTHVA